MNPQKERSLRSSREKSFSRASRGKILKIIKRKNSQEESFSRSSRGKILKREYFQHHQDHQEERFSRGFSRGISLYCSTLICCRLFSQFGKTRYVVASVQIKWNCRYHLREGLIRENTVCSCTYMHIQSSLVHTCIGLSTCICLQLSPMIGQIRFYNNHYHDNQSPPCM